MRLSVDKQMASSPEALLRKGERVLLKDNVNNGTLALTSQRLLLYGRKNMFSQDFIIKDEVALEELADIRGEYDDSHLGTVGNSWLIIVTKSGGVGRHHFDAGSMVMYDFNAAQNLSIGKASNWVNTLKLELLKRERLNVAYEVPIVEKVPVIDATNVVYCRYCGNKNPADSMFCEKCGKKIG